MSKSDTKPKDKSRKKKKGRKRKDRSSAPSIGRGGDMTITRTVTFWRGIVVAGTQCSGKTTIAGIVADWRGAPFFDADYAHDSDARVKIASGQGVTSEYRTLWQQRIIGAMINTQTMGRHSVIAASALTRSQRSDLVEASLGTHVHNAQLAVVWLDVPAKELKRRAKERDKRGGHFAKASLLESQLKTAEIPEEGEERNVIVVNGVGTPEEVAERVYNATQYLYYPFAPVLKPLPKV